jgi:hypothetical protein
MVLKGKMPVPHRKLRRLPGLIALVYVGLAALEWLPLFDEIIQRWTGAVLALLVCIQFGIGRKAVQAQTGPAQRLHRIHAWLGVVLMVALGAHVPDLDHAFLSAWGLILPVLALMGMVHHWATLSWPKRRQLWVWAHLGMGSLLLVGIPLHVWLVFAYR